MSRGLVDSVEGAFSTVKNSLIVYIVIGLIFGYCISNILVPQPVVGIVRISGAIQDESGFGRVVTAGDVITMLRYARDSSEIKAVVLDINSPGGLASASEEVYMDILRLRQEKPVVASIGSIGASGAYYIAIAGDYIYASPTSIVGSIGVVTSLPSPESIDEQTLTSGPFKETGGLKREWVYQSQLVAKAFQQAVASQRGDRLKISDEELRSARIYVGTVGLEKGLIDEIGSISDAIDKAAKMARIKNYRVMDINKAFNLTKTSSVFFVNKSDVMQETNTAPVNYYLYLEVEG
jgi:protease-4